MTSVAVQLRLRQWLPAIWCAVLILVVLAPVLAPGYVLSYDMVFVPQQTLLPWNLGIGAGLPRSVPQDAVVAFISGPIAGQLLQKAALFGALALAGAGVSRLLRSSPLGVRMAAVTMAIWNPYVAERLVQGHWSLLIAYGAFPWVLRAAIDVRSTVPGAVPRLLLWAALSSIVPSGGLLAAVAAVPAVLPGSALTPLRRAALAAGAVLLNVTWWLPAVLSPAADVSDPGGAAAFALQPEGWGGPFLTALSLGGLWNSEAVLATRAVAWAPVVGVVFALLAVAGIRSLLAALGRAAGWWLTIIAAAGFAVAVAGATALAPGVEWMISSVPGGGVLRDGQKLLAPLAMLIALAAPLGAAHLARRLRTEQGRAWLLAGLTALPLLTMPDLAWGAFGRLTPVSYPAAWQQVREQIASGPPGDAISVPWSAFRSYRWNDRRTVLDPAPRYMTTTVIADDRLPVATASGIRFIAGDNPRAAQIGAELSAGAPIAAALSAAGIRWVIEQTDQPGQLDPALLAGLALTVDAPGLRLWQVGGTTAQQPTPGGAGVIIAADAAALLLVLTSAAAGASGAVVRRRRCRDELAAPA